MKHLPLQAGKQRFAPCWESLSSGPQDTSLWTSPLSLLGGFQCLGVRSSRPLQSPLLSRPPTKWLLALGAVLVPPHWKLRQSSWGVCADPGLSDCKCKTIRTRIEIHWVTCCYAVEHDKKCVECLIKWLLTGSFNHRLRSESGIWMFPDSVMVHSFSVGRLGSKTSDKSASATNLGCIPTMRPRPCFHSYKVMTNDSLRNMFLISIKYIIYIVENTCLYRITYCGKDPGNYQCWFECMHLFLGIF